jgi:hypothetical protein
MSVGTTYDQWFYRGSEGGRHRFVVRTVELQEHGARTSEREVAVPAAELPLRSTMPVTADRSRWVEFFSQGDEPHPVGQGMSVGRIRRSMDLIPAPFGPPPDAP